MVSFEGNDLRESGKVAVIASGGAIAQQIVADLNAAGTAVAAVVNTAEMIFNISSSGLADLKDNPEFVQLHELRAGKRDQVIAAYKNTKDEPFNCYFEDIEPKYATTVLYRCLESRGFGALIDFSSDQRFAHASGYQGDLKRFAYIDNDLCFVSRKFKPEAAKRVAEFDALLVTSSAQAIAVRQYTDQPIINIIEHAKPTEDRADQDMLLLRLDASVFRESETVVDLDLFLTNWRFLINALTEGDYKDFQTVIEVYHGEGRKLSAAGGNYVYTESPHQLFNALKEVSAGRPIIVNRLCETRKQLLKGRLHTIVDLCTEGQSQRFIWYARQAASLAVVNNYSAYELLSGLPHSHVLSSALKDWELVSFLATFLPADMGAAQTLAKSPFLRFSAQRIGKLATLEERNKLNSYYTSHTTIAGAYLGEGVKDIVVFHYPYEVVSSIDRARTLRLKEIRAYLSSRFDVIEVTGSDNSKERQFKWLLDRLQGGAKVRYVYSETHTSPFSDTDGQSFERSFYSKIASLNIPLVVFVRDAHWESDHIKNVVNEDRHKNLMAAGQQDFDLILDLADVVAVPSAKFFEKYVAGGRKTAAKVVPMPAGVNFSSDYVATYSAKPRQKKIQRLIYAGGLGTIYNILEFLKVFEFENPEGVVLDVLSRADEVAAFCEKHGRPLQNVNFVEGDLLTLAGIYNYQAGFAVFDADEYMNAAMPRKISDYLACGLPIITNSGAVYSDFIKKQEYGVVFKNPLRDLRAFLADTKKYKKQIQSAWHNIQQSRADFSWTQRFSELEQNLLNL